MNTDKKEIRELSGSENGDQRAERQAQEGAAAYADAVGDYVAEFHGTAGGEVLTGLHEGSQEEHREACHKAPATISKPDHGQE